MVRAMLLKKSSALILLYLFCAHFARDWVYSTDRQRGKVLSGGAKMVGRPTTTTTTTTDSVRPDDVAGDGQVMLDCGRSRQASTGIWPMPEFSEQSATKCKKAENRQHK